MDENSLICNRLTIERCQSYCSHIQAVLYLCADENETIPSPGSNQIRQLVSLLNMELKTSYDMLNCVVTDD